MITINLYDILNSVDNTLEKNIKSYDNSFVDNFIDVSLYKVEDVIQEEIHYKNYLQLKDDVYKVVDKNGNGLQ